MTFSRPGYLAAGLMAVLLVLFPVNVSGSWNEVDEILSEAYGSQTAKDCREFFGTLGIPADQESTVRETITRLVKAGYPSGCPKEYLSLAGELSKAGIHLDDLTNKISEGIAKKVHPERLTIVITHRVDALKRGRVLTLEMAQEGIEFLDRQMTYTVMADYLLRGVDPEDLRASVTEGELSRFPALENLIR